MMEAARHWGFGAQFVTGYVQMGEGQHGATHAWTEIYIPGAGWQGYDPTNNKRAGDEHISVAVARPEKASPLSGTWKGPATPSTAWRSPCRSWRSGSHRQKAETRQPERRSRARSERWRGQPRRFDRTMDSVLPGTQFLPERDHAALVDAGQPILRP